MSTAPATDQPATGDRRAQPWIALPIYLLLGICFGIALTKSEVLSWFRIQEMFRFQSPRMYEIIGSAVAVAAASVELIKRLGLKTVSGEPIAIPPKSLGRGVRYAVGGTIFGLGWALTGACPGPLFALVGNGVTVMIAAIASALAGTWLYGLLRPRLPH
ncbi:MAG: DUF6691 family protein [Bryobacteraceae bacterium]